MKTQEQIQEAVKALEEVKPSVRRYTYFGDDNWQKIDAQIKVLKRRMDEDEIYDTWSDDMDLKNNALLAYQWMNDLPMEDLEEEIETLADMWRGLV